VASVEVEKRANKRSKDEEALAIIPPVLKVCKAVHVFAFPKLSPIVRAVCPSYVPEKVKVPSVAVRSAKSTSVEITVAHVAAPRAERTRTNWFVQVVPAYSAVIPVAPVKIRADVRPSTSRTPDTFRFVVVACVVVPKVTERFAIEEEAFITIPIGEVVGVIAVMLPVTSCQLEPPEPPPPVASVPQENTPLVLDFTSQLAAFNAETVRLVVEAF
jgi:hypothetical protein